MAIRRRYHSLDDGENMSRPVDDSWAELVAAISRVHAGDVPKTLGFEEVAEAVARFKKQSSDTAMMIVGLAKSTAETMGRWMQEGPGEEEDAFDHFTLVSLRFCHLCNALRPWEPTLNYPELNPFRKEAPAGGGK